MDWGEDDGLDDIDVAFPATSSDEDGEKIADPVAGHGSPCSRAPLVAASYTPRSGGQPDADLATQSLSPPLAPWLDGLTRAGTRAPTKLNSALVHLDALPLPWKMTT